MAWFIVTALGPGPGLHAPYARWQSLTKVKKASHRLFFAYETEETETHVLSLHRGKIIEGRGGGHADGHTRAHAGTDGHTRNDGHERARSKHAAPAHTEKRRPTVHPAGTQRSQARSARDLFTVPMFMAHI